MNINELFHSAIKSLSSNKARSILTMLGVIIGVFSVVTLVSLGRGIQNYITDEFDQIGTNLLFISPGESDIGDDPGKAFTANKLNQKHIDLINTYAREYVTAVTPFLLVGENVSYKNKTYAGELIGINADSLDIFNYQIHDGRNFTQSEESSKAKVAIIGPLIINELFGAKPAVGERIKMGDESYLVIGTFKEKGANYDDQIIIPYTSLLESFDIENYSSIIAKIKNPDEINLATRQIEIALLRDLKEDEFTVLSQKDLLESIQEILGMLTLGLGAIAGISLIVGGIGIMNIMLVSVTERIREIGLRKAVGATSRAIGIQFMLEAVLISVVGGAVGLGLGYLATLVAQQFIRAEIPLSAVFLAFGFSLLVGVLFGTYPAVSASKKDPIEALRYE